MTIAFPAADLVRTRLCKVALCVDDARDERGRFAGLCAAHKREAIALARADGTFAGSPPTTALARTANELARQARRVERTTKRLEEERQELRKLYLRFGVEAGFLGGRS